MFALMRLQIKFKHRIKLIFKLTWSFIIEKMTVVAKPAMDRQRRRAENRIEHSCCRCH